MKAVEFESTISPGGQISLHPRSLPRSRPVSPYAWLSCGSEPSNLDMAWRTAGRQRFEAGYSPEDAVYEQLIDG